MFRLHIRLGSNNQVLNLSSQGAYLKISFFLWSHLAFQAIFSFNCNLYMTVSLLKYESFNSSMHFSPKKLRYIYTKGPCTQIFFLGGGVPHPFLSKCMLRMIKRRKSNLIQFFYDGRKFQRQCVNVIDTLWGHTSFLTYKNFGQEFWTLTVNEMLELPRCLSLVFSTIGMWYPAAPHYW